MAALYKIEIAPELIFDALLEGEPGAPLVLLLHGFASSLYIWRAQVAGAGSGRLPCRRAEPARLFAGRAAGHRRVRQLRVSTIWSATPWTWRQPAFAADPRFHLVGHDWGGSLAWAIADRYPERLASLTILSRPHPIAFNSALDDAGWRSGAPLAASPGVSGARCRGRAAGRRRRWLRERHRPGRSPAAAERHTFGDRQ